MHRLLQYRTNVARFEECTMLPLNTLPPRSTVRYSVNVSSVYADLLIGGLGRERGEISVPATGL